MNGQKHDKLNIIWRHLISYKLIKWRGLFNEKTRRKQISMFHMVTKLKFNLVTSLVSDHDQDGPSINGSLLKTKGFH